VPVARRQVRTRGVGHRREKKSGKATLRVPLDTGRTI